MIDLLKKLGTLATAIGHEDWTTAIPAAIEFVKAFVAILPHGAAHAQAVAAVAALGVTDQLPPPSSAP